MTITCQQLLTEMGNRAWSGFDKDDMKFGEEEAESALSELNVALRYLTNLEDFPFRAEEYEFTTKTGRKDYSAPDGQISRIFDKETYKELSYIGNADDLDKTKTGTPTSWYVTYIDNEQIINLYPTPETRKKYFVIYNTFKPVRDIDGYTLKYKFENANDTINLPETIDYLFMDCLVLRTMVTNNKDEQDENYQPTIKEFFEHWKVFKNCSRPANRNTYFYF